MTIKLWKNFSKRKNSTKVPTSAADADRTAYLKEGTSLQAPIFIINSNEFEYNYAKFEGIYYFIDDIVSLKNGLIEIHCSRDLLATYKSEIQASSAYVLYYSHSNTEIADKRLSLKTTQTTQVETASFGFLGTSHCYVLTVIGQEHTDAYVLTQSQIEGLFGQDYRDVFDASINSLTPVSGTGFADTLADFARWLSDFLKSAAGAWSYTGSVAENIKSCKILPTTAGSIGGTPGVSIYIGAIDTLVSGFKITSRTFSDTATVNIPWQASDWRRLEPYHEIFLYIPALGLISLSPSDLIGKTQLVVKCSMDVLSGDAIFEVKADAHVVYYGCTNLATDYAIGSSQTNPSQIGNALVGAIGAATGNPLAATAGLIGFANDIKPNPICIGSNAGGAILGINADKIACYTIFHDTTVSPSSVSAVKGTPYNGVMSLSGISGYVQTAGASVNMPAFGNDKDIVNNYLDGGIYIE